MIIPEAQPLLKCRCAVSSNEIGKVYSVARPPGITRVGRETVNFRHRWNLGQDGEPAAGAATLRHM